MPGQEYITRTISSAWLCHGCGALVQDKKLHDAFHEGLYSTSLQAQQASVYTNVIGPKPRTSSDDRDDAFDRHGWST